MTKISDDKKGSHDPDLVPDPISLAVVIVTYNSADVLPGLLDSLPAGCEGIDRVEVIVVDNDSHDTSVGIARSHPVKPRVIETGRNAGYAAGINAAIATIASNTDVLVLNPDIRLLPGSARILCEHLCNSSIGVAVPQILHESGEVALSLRREPSLMTAWTESVIGGTLAAKFGLGETVNDPDLYRQGGSVEWATGAALMISARARLAVGDWDESFFLYSEEVDYLRRIRECGLSVGYLPRAQAVHIGGDYQSSPFLSALMTVNRIRDYGRRHGVLATGAFRLALIVGEAIRSGFSPAHRAAFRAALLFPQHGMQPMAKPSITAAR